VLGGDDADFSLATFEGNKVVFRDRPTRCFRPWRCSAAGTGWPSWRMRRLRHPVSAAIGRLRGQAEPQRGVGARLGLAAEQHAAVQVDRASGLLIDAGSPPPARLTKCWPIGPSSTTALCFRRRRPICSVERDRAGAWPLGFRSWAKSRCRGRRSRSRPSYRQARWRMANEKRRGKCSTPRWTATWPTPCCNSTGSEFGRQPSDSGANLGLAPPVCRRHAVGASKPRSPARPNLRRRSWTSWRPIVSCCRGRAATPSAGPAARPPNL